MDLTIHEDRGITVIEIVGEIDISCSEELLQTCDRLLETGCRRFILDLHHVEFVDSAGLSVLVRCFKHVQSQAGRLFFAALRPPVRRVIELTRLDQAFEIRAQVEEAVQDMARQQKPS